MIISEIQTKRKNIFQEYDSSRVEVFVEAEKVVQQIVSFFIVNSLTNKVITSRRQTLKKKELSFDLEVVVSGRGRFSSRFTVLPRPNLHRNTKHTHTQTRLCVLLYFSPFFPFFNDGSLFSAPDEHAQLAHDFENTFPTF